MEVKELCIDKEMSIKKAIQKLDQTAKQLLIVLENNKLIGVITDGDIRRWILKNGDLYKEVYYAMNENPITINIKDKEKAKAIMQEKSIQSIPIINDKKELISVVFWNDFFEKRLNHYEDMDVPVIIMAGGKGTRLLPYTKIIPKPLIPIGDITIVERIINSFCEYGCKEIFLTVNYKKNMIKSYFEDVQKEYNINYIEETKPLGTGGSLYMLKDKINSTFFVSNCDILINANYSDILKYHKEQKNKITLVTSMKNYIIPYGVIEIGEDECIKDIKEKPEMDLLINTGLYVLELEVIDDIPKDEFYNITELINKYLKEGKKIGTYPISENSWMDMGQIEEMNNMSQRLEAK